MDTKWKNRWIGLIVGCLLLVFGVSSLFSLSSNGNQYLFKDYFESDEFRADFYRYEEWLGKHELIDMTEEEAKESVSASKNEIKDYRYNYGTFKGQKTNIEAEYNYQIDNARAAGDKEKMNELTAERDKKIQQMKTIFEDDEYVKGKIISRKTKQIEEYYKLIDETKMEFSQYNSVFRYILKDVETGEVFTNLKAYSEKRAEELISAPDMVHIMEYPSGISDTLRVEMPPGVNKVPRQFEGKIGLLKSAPETNPLVWNYHQFLEKQKLFYWYTASGLASLVLGLYLLARVLFRGKETSPSRIIPLDVGAFLFTVIAFFLLIYIKKNSSYYLGDVVNSGELVLKWLISGFWMGVSTLLFSNLAKRLLGDASTVRADLKRSVMYRIYKGIKDAFLLRSIGFQTFFLLGVIAAFIPAAYIVADSNWFLHKFLVFFLFLLFGVPAMIIIIKRAGQFNKISAYTSELANGNLGPDLEIKGNSPLDELGRNITKIKQGVKISMKEQAKSERLKTELITNVSHDLRTPLTSIITYTELLKSPEATEEDRTGYIDIIDRKSKRLKVLIDDLFEASKMASGNVELQKANVDIVQLLQQSLAEHEEDISKSSLQFRFSNPEEPVYCHVDGQKIWRVFDNLIGNILKYSLEYSRVFISVSAGEGRAAIVLKNVTKFELSEEVDELFERFKRGDASRNTEGSGLGLAIAKSIVDLHEGDMDIEVDGDLFKVSVVLPCAD